MRLHYLFGYSAIKAVLLVVFSCIFLMLSLSLAHADDSHSENLQVDEVKTVAMQSEADFLDEIPNAVSISRLDQAPKDAPSASTIIDREMIRAAGIIDLAEVFRLVPGFYVGTNAGFSFSTNHAVSYHGLSDAYARRMQVLIDGRTVYEPLFGGVLWSELPIVLDDILRIEITRGPNAASFGANAFLGTINIITLNAAETQGNRVTLKHGNGRNEAFYRYGGKTEDSHYRINAGYKQDDGLSNRSDGKRTNLLNFQSDYQINPQQNLEFQFGYVQGKRQEGEISLDPSLFVPRTKDIYNHFELIKWTNKLSADSEFYVQGYHSFGQSDDDFLSGVLANPAAPLPPLINNVINIKSKVDSRRYDLEAQHSLKISRDFRLAWGGSIRLDQLKAPFYLSHSETKEFHLQRLFAQAEFTPHEKLVVNLGTMLEHNDFTGTDGSPRVSINFSPSPQHTFRFGVSTATRTPTYFEEKFNSGIKFPSTNPAVTYLRQFFADTGGLKPERILSKELGYMGQFSQASIDLKIFSDEIKDNIYSIRNRAFTFVRPIVRVGSRPISFVNSGEIQINGFETQIKWQPFTQTQLLANYARVRIGTSNGADNDFGDIEESTPRDTVSLLWNQQLNGSWNASIAGYYTTPVTALGDGNPVNSNQRWDARVARSFSLGKTKGEVSLNIQNMFDKHDIEFARYNELRRRAFLNLQLDF